MPYYYIDQFIIFNFKIFVLSCFCFRENTLFVLVDQALSPYLISLSRRRTVVHVHDLLALDASRGNQEFRRLNINSVVYQRFIASFFGWSKNFIAVSIQQLVFSSVKYRLILVLILFIIHCRLTILKRILNRSCIVQVFSRQRKRKKYLFHIGRNWYKNREGLLLLWMNT